MAHVETENTFAQTQNTHVASGPVPHLRTTGLTISSNICIFCVPELIHQSALNRLYVI